MIRLNRTTEYGLMALRHMSQKQAAADAAGSAACGVTSAREISDCYGLPFEITAKTLQRLKDRGLIHSAQGAKGGYTLKRSLGDINLAEFMEWMEGPQNVVACLDGAAGATTAAKGTPCEYGSRCEIQKLMGDLNTRVLGFLAGIRLADIATGSRAPTYFEEP